MKDYRNTIEEFLNNDFAIALMKSIVNDVNATKTCFNMYETEDDEKESKAKEMADCFSRNFKATKIYTVMRIAENIKSKKTETIELNKFFKTFSANCRLQIRDKFKINLLKCDDEYIEINKEILNFILVMPIREFLKYSAEKVDISFSSELNHITICMKADKGEMRRLFREKYVNDEFLEEYGSSIMLFVMEKAGGKIWEEGNCIYIELPKSRGEVFNSNNSAESNDNSVEVIEYMLADFGLDIPD